MHAIFVNVVGPLGNTKVRDLANAGRLDKNVVGFQILRNLSSVGEN